MQPATATGASGEVEIVALRPASERTLAPGMRPSVSKSPGATDGMGTTVQLLELPVVCANTTTSYPCPLGGATFEVTGQQRRNALRRAGRVYCSRACSDAGRRENMSAAAKDRWADPAARARLSETMKRLGDEIGYGARHDRLRRAFGPASAHQCADCDRQADDWSLNAGVPPERLRADAIGYQQGLPFSMEDSDYSPRCHSCHCKLDGRPIEAERLLRIQRGLALAMRGSSPGFIRFQKRTSRPTRLRFGPPRKPLTTLVVAVVKVVHINGRPPRQQFVAYLGTIHLDDLPFPDARRRFWGLVDERLEQFTHEAREKFEQSIAVRIPRPPAAEPDLSRAQQLAAASARMQALRAERAAQEEIAS